MKKSERTMSLRNYLVHLRENDDIISTAYHSRMDGETLKAIHTEEFIEYCHSLELSNRNIATILNCSAGTVGQYVAAYVRIRFDDILFEEVDYTEEIQKYEPEVGTAYPLFQEEENVVLMVSDIQAGALVTSEGYDSNPAKTVDIYFELLIDRLLETLIKRKIKITTFNIVMLGDLVDGWKKFANQLTIPIRAQKEVLVKNILKLIKQISVIIKPEYINIYGVWGNHGVIDRFYPSSDNWDTIVMEEVETHIGYLRDLDKDFENVHCYIEDEETQIQQIGHFRYFLTHGHQVSSFSVEAWKKAMKDWHISTGGFDAMLMGHWHTFTWASNSEKDLVVNGCTYRSEFVQHKLKGRENVCQVLFGQNEMEPVAWVEKLNVDQGFIAVDK